MYKGFFNMSKTPFSKDISESALYIGPHFKELQGRLKTAAAERLFLVVTGDSGCGRALVRFFSRSGAFRPLLHKRFGIIAEEFLLRNPQPAWRQAAFFQGRRQKANGSRTIEDNRSAQNADCYNRRSASLRQGNADRDKIFAEF